MSGDIPRGTECVLVVDDEEALRALVRRALERLGYKVLEADDGQKGVEVFRAHQEHIDLVLLDLSMPRKSGQEVLRELFLLDADVRAVVFTGYADDEARVEGAREVMHKPLALDVLARKVRAVLDA